MNACSRLASGEQLAVPKFPTISFYKSPLTLLLAPIRAEIGLACLEVTSLRVVECIFLHPEYPCRAGCRIRLDVTPAPHRTMPTRQERHTAMLKLTF